MTHGVNASMHQMQLPPLQPAVNLTRGQAKLFELTSANHSVLRFRKPNHSLIGRFVRRIDLALPIRPPLTTSEVANGGRVRHRRRW